jgi:hypothetical protein
VAVLYKALNITVHLILVVAGLYDLSSLIDTRVHGGDLVVRFSKEGGL